MSKPIKCDRYHRVEAKLNSFENVISCITHTTNVKGHGSKPIGQSGICDHLEHDISDTAHIRSVLHIHCWHTPLYKLENAR